MSANIEQHLSGQGAEGVVIADFALAHLPALAEVVRMNDSAIAHLMERDVRGWWDRGRPANEGYFTALAGDRPVGMTGFQPDPWRVADISWLVWLYIDGSWKRRGVATMLFHHAQDVLRARGCRKVYLDVGNADAHASAIAFHERDGFVREGFLKDFWEDGEDFIVFGKRLAP